MSVKVVFQNIIGTILLRNVSVALQEDLFLTDQIILVPAPREPSMTSKQRYVSNVEHLEFGTWNKTDVFALQVFLSITQLRKIASCVLRSIRYGTIGPA